jgi:hypothetical protein
VFLEAELAKDIIEQAAPLPVVRLIQVEDDRHMVADVDGLQSGSGGRFRGRSFVTGAGQGVGRVRHGGESGEKAERVVERRE